MHTQILNWFLGFFTSIVHFMQSCTVEILGHNFSIFTFLLGFIVVCIIANQLVKRAGV